MFSQPEQSYIFVASVNQTYLSPLILINTYHLKKYV